MPERALKVCHKQRFHWAKASDNGCLSGDKKKGRKLEVGSQYDTGVVAQGAVRSDLSENS